MMIVRAAGGLISALLLASCASNPPGNAAPPAADAGMAGRWMLEAPNAPMCGMNFAGPPGAREGRVAPDGGCPGNFFMSRRWTLEQGGLLIKDEDDQPLATLNAAGDRFEGRAATGIPVTLTRPALPPG